MNEPMQHGAVPVVSGPEGGQSADIISVEIQKEIEHDNAVAAQEAKKGCHLFGHKCCGCFQGHQTAIGYNTLGLGE
jgi:hypothetical protein